MELERQIIKVESSTRPGTFYFIDLRERTCTCPGFRYRGKCKHLKKAEEIEEMKRMLKDIVEVM